MILINYDNEYNKIFNLNKNIHIYHISRMLKVLINKANFSYVQK